MTQLATYCVRIFILAYVMDSTALAEVPVPDQFSLFDGERVFQADGSRGPYSFSDRTIEIGSERIWVNGILMVRDQGYVVDANRALITFMTQVFRGDEVVVRFRQMPKVFDPLARRRIAKATDEGTARVEVPAKRTSVSRIEGDEPRLTIGGHKSIAVTVGSQHTVNQALQLRISGEVAEGVDLLAVLSDRNLPITEGGGSRRLQELDRVFFQVKSGGVLASLGDLDVAFDATAFGRYRRQLQGAQVFAQRDGGQVKAFGAASRGRWITQRLVAVEAYQGPYRLPGAGGEQIVPESERVYLNGRLLKRGDLLDYTVDYTRGSIIFSPEVVIGIESRITAEYQIIENGMRSRLMGVESRWALTEGLSFGTTLIRESDRPALTGVNVPGISETRRQLGVLNATYAPRSGVHLSGEAALSDRDAGRASAFRIDGEWASGDVKIMGRFRQLGADFEPFERLDRGDAAGRWGWQEDSVRTTEHEGEVGVRYDWGESFSVTGEVGRRSGLQRTDRRGVGIRLPMGTYRYEFLDQGNGVIRRHEGQFERVMGMVKPGFRFDLETALGDGVYGSSLFYAFRPQSVPAAIGKRELVWNVVVGDGAALSWASELKYRQIRQRDLAWQDSLRGWSHTHRMQMNNWRGWVFDGSYTRSASQTGEEHRQVAHLGRVRLGHSHPGLSHQVTYRVSSTGVQINRPLFVGVSPGLGEYIWEDANGDGLRDPEEFVPDVDGDYVQVYDNFSAFNPARDGALGVRIEIDFRRLLKEGGLLSAVSLDASLRADRQVIQGAGGAAPWSLFAFDSGRDVLGSRRDALVRLYLFRYHKRGSLRLTGQARNLLNRALYGGAAESFIEGGVLGKLRSRNGVAFETEFDLGRRHRRDAGTFSYVIETETGVLRGVLQPSRKWHLRLALQGGRDWERIRGLRVVYSGIRPEVIHALPGRGRLHGRVDWMRVWSTEAAPLFLGLAEGNRSGQNWTWRFGFDYRLGRYVTAQVMYNGRKHPEREIIHLGRMEMRAAF